MVDQTNIFEGEKADEATTESAPAPQAFQVPETVSELVGEGRKYSDVSKALESIPHAQTHIQKLEEELAQTRAKLEAASSVEETLSNFAKSQQEQDIPTSQPIDLNEVQNLVDQRIAAQQKAKIEENNVKAVVDTLSKQFGDAQKAEAAFIAKAEELGLGIDYLNNLAATSPKATYALFGSETAPKSQTFNTSSVNTGALDSTKTESKPIKSVMYGASTSDLLDAWRSSTANIGD